MSTAYLIAYNLASCGGWAYVWAQVAQTILGGGNASMLWERAGFELQVVQSLAALEILHSVVKLVKSPVMTVFLQVMSRLIVLWLYTYPATACHNHWSLLLMVGSWATVEVPRYLFYALNLIPQFQGEKMPYPLFWLRYSLFMVLYPTGITGELVQMYVAITSFFTLTTPWQRFLAIFPLLAYPPAGPFMVLNMWMNRKSQFKKRAAAKSGAPKKRKAEGLSWPITNEATGDRSTSQTNQSIWEAAVANVDPKAAQAIRTTKKWRFGYDKHIEAQVRLALKSKENAVQIAQDGLKKAYDSFVFIRDEKEYPFSEAMKKFTGSFETGFIQGEGKRTTTECTIQYKGKSLTGAALEKQLSIWEQEGTMEPSAADSIRQVMKNPEWVDLSDKYFVLLGATSAMGPLDLLLACGANIIGIDIDRPFVWEKLINKVRKSAGTLTFPMSKPQKQVSSDEELYKVSGCNLLTQTPEIANWVETVFPGKQLTIGNYTYLDGALHVQLTLACDAIMDRLCNARKDTAIAFLCTPTDVHNISEEAYKAASDNYKNAPFYLKLAEKIIGGKHDMRNNAIKPVQESGLCLTDGTAVRQGPNYSLAKRLQHYRAVLAKESGHVVSSNVAPSTSTASVTSNPLFAAAYEGFVLFKALEVMAPETSSSGMLALLINDLRNPESASHPSFELSNPMEMFAYNAFHGGSFRAGYKIGSIGTVSVLYYVAKHYGLILAPIMGCLTYGVKYVAVGV